MNILYIANIRMPTEKAHGVQIMHTCEAFANLGHTVRLLVTDRKTEITEDPFVYYGIKNRFPLIHIHVPDTVRFGKLGFLFESFMFAKGILKYLQSSTHDVLYGRDEFVLARLPAPYVWESHTGAWSSAAQLVAHTALRVVVISQGLKDFYVEKGVPAEKIVVAHDGINLEQFANPESKESARTRLGLPLDKKIAMYIGRLDGWKGTDTLLEASKLLPADVLLAVMGGEPRQVAECSKQYPHVRFLGYRPYTELPDNQAAADVLVLPNTGTDDISVRFTSPLKLFSYMAANRPIVASDLPSIREVLGESSAYLVAPDDSAALAQGIRRALEDDAAASKATQAREMVASYSWSERAKRILQALLAPASVAQ